MAEFIAVTSGKGGVGKTLVSLHLAYASILKGKRTLVIDLDLGLANADIVLNIDPRYNIRDIIDGKVNSMEALTKTPFGFDLLASVSGSKELANMSDVTRFQLIDSMQDFERQFDIVILDMGAGLGSNVVDFASACTQVIVVTTPDPHAIADAYAMTKVVHGLQKSSRISLLVNQASSLDEARSVFERIAQVSEKYLNARLNYLAGVCRDSHFQRHVARQQVLSREALATMGSNQMIEGLSSFINEFSRLQKVTGRDWSSMYNAPRQRTTNAF